VTLTIRTAEAGDEGLILAMVKALATYEREPDAVKATEESIRASLFVPDALVHAFIAEVDGQPVGFALWFLTYSTWTGRPSLYLEDLYVDDAARGQGIARALFRRLAREAKARNCARIDWAVLDWNVDAMAFYRRIGGARQTGWQPWRLHGEALGAMAAEAD
jgi:GNAT superfamily N-acetyltransferase